KLKTEHGIDAEVIDVRSLVPLDTQTIMGSVGRTHRLFTVEENPRLCGWGAEIVSIVADEAFYDLDGPPVRITTPHIPLPAAKAAIDAAHDAFAGWAARKPRERAEILRKAFELIVRDAERFAKLITIENGKALSDSKGEVLYSAEFFRWNAEEAVRNIGQVYMAPASGARVVAQHKPAGVAVLVTPWNFPAAMAT